MIFVDQFSCNSCCHFRELPYELQWETEDLDTLGFKQEYFQILSFFFMRFDHWLNEQDGHFHTSSHSFIKIFSSA